MDHSRLVDPTAVQGKRCFAASVSIVVQLRTRCVDFWAQERRCNRRRRSVC